MTVFISSCIESASYVLDEISTTRKAALQKEFLIALTQGNPKNANTRPIEIHAHDPIKYVGDMLGWIHQRIADENEFMLTIFGISLGVENSDKNTRGVDQNQQKNDKKGDKKNDKKDDKNQQSEQHAKPNSMNKIVLSKMFEGVSRAFKLRFDQICTSNPKPSLATLYRLSNLTQFYLTMITKTLPEDSLLPETLHS